MPDAEDNQSRTRMVGDLKPPRWLPVVEEPDSIS
jgi:hypothetical protein